MPVRWSDGTETSTASPSASLRIRRLGVAKVEEEEGVDLLFGQGGRRAPAGRVIASQLRLNESPWDTAG